MPIKRETETPASARTTESDNLAAPNGAGPGGGDPAIYAMGEALVEGVCAFFCSADERISKRLAASRASATFHLTDAEPLAMTVYLDRVPTEAEPAARDADVVVWGKTDSLAKIFLGRDHMALMIARGEIAFEGPVRRVLRAVPIMRKLDVELLKDLAAARRDLKSKDKPASGEGER